MNRTCLQCGKTFWCHDCQVRRGGGKFCCTSCGIRYRDLHNNPSKRPEVRAKISANHADVSGDKNPMYGKNAYANKPPREKIQKKQLKKYVRVLIDNGVEKKCFFCGLKGRLHVHHKDGNHNNNDLENLMWVCAKCHNTKAHHYSRNELGRYIGAQLGENTL